MDKICAVFCLCIGASLLMAVLGEQRTPWKVYDSTKIYFTASFNKSHINQLPGNVTHLYLPNSGFVNITYNTFPNLTSLQHLMLTYNSIQSIENGTFKKLENLVNLSLALNIPFLENSDDCNHGLSLPGNVFDGLQKLTMLNLSFIGLPAVSRELFANVTSLQTLSLAWNCITDSSLEEDSFVDLVNLRVLDLSHAMITFIPAEMFSSLTKLQVLNILSSQLLSLPSDPLAPLVNLKDLQLGGNFTSVEFGEEFKNLTDLETFKLKGCYPQNPFEHHCKQLQILSVTICYLRTQKLVITQDLGLDKKALTFLLKHLPVPSMKTLILNWVDARNLINSSTFGGCNDSSLGGVIHLDLSHTNLVTIKNYVFKSFSGLEKLDLSKNKLSNIQPNAFKGLKKLVELDLSSNSITVVPNLTVFGDGKLQILKLSNNELHRVIDVNTFRVVPTLQELYLDNTAITEVTLESLKGCKLKVLDLSNNHLLHLKKLNDILSNLTSLEILNLSGNNFYNGYYTNTPWGGSLSALKNLTYLNLNRCPVNWKVLSSVTSLEELHLENIQNGKLLYLNWNHFDLKFPKLTYLSLSGSDISVLNDTMMSTMPNLEYLNLQRNGFDALDRDVFVKMKKLKTLDVSHNAIKTITGTWNMKHLRNISLASNRLSSIDDNFINGDQLPNLEYLDLSWNSFTCDCDLQWFLDWMSTDTKVRLYDSEGYQCSLASDRITSVNGFYPDVQQCGSFLITKISVSVSCVVVLIAVVIAVMVYRRWYIRYACFLFRSKVNGYRELVDIEENAKPFDVFVSYNSSDQNWVLRNFVPQMESKLKFQVCVDYKNFIPGKTIIDNIIDSIQNSRKTILVLTPNFVKSEWCYFEMEMALHRLFDEGRDVVILLLLEPIQDGDLPRKLRKLFTKKTYVEWPEEECETAMHLFWAKLENAVKLPTKVDRIHKL